jgi:low affinity Fe/Cu permease
MKKYYHTVERWFERIASIATFILGNSITFIIALVTIIIWLSSKRFYAQDPHECLRDVIHGVTFLSLFIIQKSFNRVIGSLHLKVNELVVSHDTASNAVIKADHKTEHEIIELSKEYIQKAEEALEEAEQISIPEVVAKPAKKASTKHTK